MEKPRGQMRCGQDQRAGRVSSVVVEHDGGCRKEEDRMVTYAGQCTCGTRGAIGRSKSCERPLIGGIL